MHQNEASAFTMSTIHVTTMNHFELDICLMVIQLIKQYNGTGVSITQVIMASFLRGPWF
jgi:hypothetical protein